MTDGTATETLRSTEGNNADQSSLSIQLTDLPKDVLLRIYSCLLAPSSRTSRRTLQCSEDVLSLSLTCTALRHLFSVAFPFATQTVDLLSPNAFYFRPKSVYTPLSARQSNNLLMYPALCGAQLKAVHLNPLIPALTVQRFVKRIGKHAPNVEQLTVYDGGQLDVSTMKSASQLNRITTLNIGSISNSFITCLSDSFPVLTTLTFSILHTPLFIRLASCLHARNSRLEASCLKYVHVRLMPLQFSADGEHDEESEHDIAPLLSNNHREWKDVTNFVYKLFELEKVMSKLKVLAIEGDNSKQRTLELIKYHLEVYCMQNSYPGQLVIELDLSSSQEILSNTNDMIEPWYSFNPHANGNASGGSTVKKPFLIMPKLKSSEVQALMMEYSKHSLINRTLSLNDLIHFIANGNIVNYLRSKKSLLSNKLPNMLVHMNNSTQFKYDQLRDNEKFTYARILKSEYCQSISHVYFDKDQTFDFLMNSHINQHVQFITRTIENLLTHCTLKVVELSILQLIRTNKSYVKSFATACFSSSSAHHVESLVLRQSTDYTSDHGNTDSWDCAQVVQFLKFVPTFFNCIITFASSTQQHDGGNGVHNFNFMKSIVMEIKHKIEHSNQGALLVKQEARKAMTALEQVESLYPDLDLESFRYQINKCRQPGG